LDKNVSLILDEIKLKHSCWPKNKRFKHSCTI